MPLNTELKEGGGGRQVKFNVTHKKSSDPPPPPLRRLIMIAHYVRNQRQLMGHYIKRVT